MRKLFLIAVMLAFLPGCHRGHQEWLADGFADSVAVMAPDEGYAVCLERLRADPGGEGRLYHTAYYRAVEADSMRHYARVLDSLGRLEVSAPNRFYIATFKAMCAYMLKDRGFDSLVAAAASLPPSSDQTQEEICAHLTARLMCESDPPAAYDMQQRAVHAMRHGGRWLSAQVLAQAAMLCCDRGRFPQAMDLLNEAQDTLAATGWPMRDAVYVLGNKSNLYSSVEMYDSALTANSRALELARPNDYLLTDLFTFRAFIFAGKGAADSAFVYLDSAENVVDRLREPHGGVLRNYIRARRAVLSVKYCADKADLSQAIADLDAYVAGRHGLWEEQLSLGYARWLTGDVSGLSLMEQARDSIAQCPDPALLLGADRNLIEIYTSMGRLGDASRLYGETFALADSIDIIHARYQSIAADLQYRVKAHLRENSRLKAEISHERDRVLWLTLACVLGAALLIWAGIYLVLSHRLHVRRRAVDSHQITTLIENQKMLNRRIEQLQSGADMEKNWSELTPSSMSAEDTARFRHSFTALYPEFLTRLRARCQGLTPGDENLCMLIRIGQSTDDIALALGISRASVNSARYRIRKKMGLGKEESLDDLINSL